MRRRHRVSTNLTREGRYICGMRRIAGCECDLRRGFQRFGTDQDKTNWSAQGQVQPTQPRRPNCSNIGVNNNRGLVGMICAGFSGTSECLVPYTSSPPGIPPRTLCRLDSLFLITTVMSSSKVDILMEDWSRYYSCSQDCKVLVSPSLCRALACSPASDRTPNTGDQRSRGCDQIKD